jgi:hypothetical protein
VYEIRKPCKSPKEYPERIMNVEYRGKGGKVVRKIQRKRMKCPSRPIDFRYIESESRPECNIRRYQLQLFQI